MAQDPTPVPPITGSRYASGLDWDAGEAARAEAYAQGLLQRGQQALARARALSGDPVAYLGLLARTSAVRKSGPAPIDVQR